MSHFSDVVEIVEAIYPALLRYCIEPLSRHSFCSPQRIASGNELVESTLSRRSLIFINITFPVIHRIKLLRPHKCTLQGVVSPTRVARFFINQALSCDKGRNATYP